MLQRCDALACGLRARDAGLDASDGEVGGCLRRCDTPVAAVRDGRALTVVAHGRTEPWSPPSLPRQPLPPVLLRDAGLPDQPTVEAARRRGAYAALARLTEAQTAELAATVERTAWDGPGAFAARVLCDRDPHLVVEGLALLSRAAGRMRATVPFALADAAAEARAAGLLSEFLPTAGPFDLVRAAWLARAAAAGAAFTDAHRTRLCAVSGDVLRPGLYELAPTATAADALAAAGGVVAGVRTSSPGRVVADGVTTSDLAAPAPVALVALHAQR